MPGRRIFPHFPGSSDILICPLPNPQAQERAAELFKEGDVNNDGTLSLIELRDILLKGADDFPQMAEYATFLDG